MHRVAEKFEELQNNETLFVCLFLRGTSYAEKITYNMLSSKLFVCVSVCMDELMYAWRLLINQKGKPLPEGNYLFS